MNIELKKVELTNGETLGYRKRAGGNKLLLLLHGNMTSSKHWDLFLENFNEEYTLIAPDMRGFGISTYNNTIDSIEDFVSDLELFVDELNLKEFSLMGWSTGGCTAMQYTANNQEKVNKLILLESISSRGNPLFELDEEGNIIPEKRIATMEAVANDEHNIKPTLNAIENENKAFMKSVWNTLIYNNNKPSEERYDEYLEDMFTQRNLVEVYHALNHFNISDKHNGLAEGTGEAAQITIPTLVLYGENDNIIPANMPDEIVEDIGENAELEILKNSGHSPLIDDLEQLIEKVNQFLKK
ncbi:MAG TPA: alpha/beta hydrolase [Halanaerobiales bacterium]|nr:alpha/beta hydrolase [Halanaerobiales bacterium]